MDARYSKDGLSLKKIALNVLCLYAAAYPLVAHCFMDGAAVGTLVVQLFQVLPILSLAYLWRFRRKSRSLKSYIDVWTISLVYFTCAAFYFALFYAPVNQFSEIVCVARFLSWFWLAATFKRVDLEPAFLERLAKSFWIGATIQCLIAIWGTIWGLRYGLASTYSNVAATTGSADVSGKTVVAFVVLGVALSIYWFLVKRRLRFAYGACALLGLAVVLCSYNRASQLGLAVAYFISLLACLRKKRFKAAGALLAASFVFVAFILSGYGNRFMARWETVVSDRGSGRVAMIEIAAERVVEPESAGVFWFGRGVYQVQEMMYEEIGSRIGMHNDLLDFTIAYGAVGAALCVWAIYSVLNFRKWTPKYSLENYFATATSIFVVLTGLCTGMFQATYVYFMLIATQYYWTARARERAWEFERRRALDEMAWNEAFWARENRIPNAARGDCDDEEDWEGREEYADWERFDGEVEPEESESSEQPEWPRGRDARFCG